MSSDDMPCCRKTIQGGGISTKVLGKSGKITIDARGSSMTFQVDSVIEVDSNGEGVSNTGARGHQFTTLANQNFTFSTPDDSSYFQGIKVVNINMTADLAKGVNAKLEIMLYIFLEDGNVTFGNESFKVYNGSLKFNIQVCFGVHLDSFEKSSFQLQFCCLAAPVSSKFHWQGLSVAALLF